MFSANSGSEFNSWWLLVVHMKWSKKWSQALRSRVSEVTLESRLIYLLITGSRIQSEPDSNRTHSPSNIELLMCLRLIIECQSIKGNLRATHYTKHILTISLYESIWLPLGWESSWDRKRLRNTIHLSLLYITSFLCHYCLWLIVFTIIMNQILNQSYLMHTYNR
jgi:hypothetical protein